MKNRNYFLKSLFILCLVALIYSCEQQSINPSLRLDEVFIPKGYTQIENPSLDIQSRLDELRLENPEDQYYYLQRENQIVLHSRKEWLFPQKELLIKYVHNNKSAEANKNPKLMGVIVKKIKGDWREEEFMIIDEQPKPHEGFKALYTFVAENLKYPVQARKMGIEGKVFVEFIVDNDGKLINVKTIKGIGAGCDQEAVSVLKQAPKWIPGKVADMPVKVRMILPITYKLSPSVKNSTKIEEVVFD